MHAAVVTSSHARTAALATTCMHAAACNDAHALFANADGRAPPGGSAARCADGAAGTCAAAAARPGRPGLTHGGAAAAAGGAGGRAAGMSIAGVVAAVRVGTG